MSEEMQPIDPITAAMLMGQVPDPCEPIIEITRKVLTRLMDVVEFGDQLERVEKDRLLAHLKEVLAADQPMLWAMHSPGPGEVHPMISKEEAERQQSELLALCKKQFPAIDITVNVIPSPYSPAEHFELLAEELTEQVANLRQAVATGSTPAPVGAMPLEISRTLLGKIVDELFGGAIEDPSVIEDVYRVIAREHRTAPAVVNQQLTTAELTNIRCQCCQAEHAADSYDAGFIAGSGMCQACDAAIPAKDIHTPAACDVLAERHRQVTVEGYHGFRDNHYISYELSKAARAYIEVSWHALSNGPPCAKPTSWPWRHGFKWSDGRTMLVKAGALILAEIERLDRASKSSQQEPRP